MMILEDSEFDALMLDFSADILHHLQEDGGLDFLPVLGLLTWVEPADGPHKRDGKLHSEWLEFKAASVEDLLEGEADTLLEIGFFTGNGEEELLAIMIATEAEVNMLKIGQSPQNPDTTVNLMVAGRRVDGRVNGSMTTLVKDADEMMMPAESQFYKMADCQSSLGHIIYQVCKPFYQGYLLGRKIAAQQNSSQDTGEKGTENGV